MRAQKILLNKLQPNNCGLEKITSQASFNSKKTFCLPMYRAHQEIIYKHVQTNEIENIFSIGTYMKLVYL